MKSYEEIAKSVFERRDKLMAMKKRKKRIVISIVAPVLCYCIVIFTSLGLWKSGFFSSNIPTIDNPQNMTDDINNSSTGDDTPSTTVPGKPPVADKNYNIDSIDKINFYSAKKIISENLLLPLGTGNNVFSSPRIKLLNNIYTENPIDRNKVFTTTMVTYFTVKLNDE